MNRLTFADLMVCFDRKPIDAISVRLQFAEYVSAAHRKEIRDAHYIVDASGISTPNPESEDLLTIDINHSKE